MEHSKESESNALPRMLIFMVRSKSSSVVCSSGAFLASTPAASTATSSLPNLSTVSLANCSFAAGSLISPAIVSSFAWSELENDETTLDSASADKSTSVMPLAPAPRNDYSFLCQRVCSLAVKCAHHNRLATEATGRALQQQRQLVSSALLKMRQTSSQ